MFKSAIVYRIAADWSSPTLESFGEGLSRARFVPCGSTDARSAGWVEPRGRENAALVESVGGQLILSLRTETRAVPASAVKTALDERLRRVEDETGSRPRGKRRKELKEEVIVDLLPRAFSKFSTTRLWLDPEARMLVVGTGSIARADEAIAALMEVLRGVDNAFRAKPIQTALSPSVAMSRWLSEREAPAGFSIDRECELQQMQAASQSSGLEAGADNAGASQAAADSPALSPGDGKATIRYARHTLDLDEIVRHIEQGKLATKLAMTWQDRVSFMLDASMKLTKVEILDVALEESGSGQGLDGNDDSFDADVTIASSELGRLIPELLEALGGECQAAPADMIAESGSDAALEMPTDPVPRDLGFGAPPGADLDAQHRTTRNQKAA